MGSYFFTIVILCAIIYPPFMLFFFQGIDIFLNTWLILCFFSWWRNKKYSNNDKINDIIVLIFISRFQNLSSIIWCLNFWMTMIVHYKYTSSEKKCNKIDGWWVWLRVSQWKIHLMFWLQSVKIGSKLTQK